MSQHSASPRLEALESSVSEIQERMSELVGMLRQLTTETRTAGDGRRGEESGGARRDAAHIYSSGTRRGPLTAATGYRVTAVQDEGAGEATAARNFPVHHRAASEPADTRPGLPTGVGPMIDVRSGETRDPYLAGITAYDQGRDVLRAEFKSLPARVVPPVLKAEKGGFQKFKHEFFLKTNMLDITDHFVGQGMRVVPVGDPLKHKAVLLQEGFSNEEIKGAYQAWNFIDAALQSDSDRSILKRCKSPREVFERLEKWHDPDSEVATQRLYDKFHEFAIPPHSDPIAALHDLEDINNQMHEKGIGRIPDAVLHARFVRALPDEYSLVKETLQAMKNRDRDEIIRMVSTRHSNLPQKREHSEHPDSLSKHSSPAKAVTAAVRDEVVTAGAGGDRAVADVETTAAEEATTSALERPAVGQVVLLEPNGAAMVAVTRAAAATAATISPLAAVSAADREATGGKTARRGRATSYPDVTGAQVTVMRRVPAHRTWQYLWWSCRYPKKTSPWKPRRSRFRRQASAV